jgi:ribosomal protein S12 methylthiotransferase
MAKIGLISLGCPKNTVDAEEILGEAVKAGHVIETDPCQADVLIVNTCGFIRSAKEESIDAVLDAIRFKTDGACRSVIVTGCLAQRYGDELAKEIPEADAFVGVGHHGEIAGTIERTLGGDRVLNLRRPTAWWTESRSRVLSTAPWTAYVRVADGCDNRCSYCAIPDIRGGFASRPEESIVSEVRGLAGQGVREINLVAQDVTRYGLDIYGRLALPGLLDKLSEIEGIDWIRLLYLYPSRVTDELVRAIAGNEKVCKYVDIPLQHCSERILQMMRRPGSRSEYRDLIARIRDACPSVAIRTTFIVGFPGETEADFDELMEFVEETRFDRMGAFEYSREEGTPAAEMAARVPSRTAKSRVRRLMSLQQGISLERNQELVGSSIEVLLERIEGDIRIGRSSRDAPDIDGVVCVHGSCAAPGEIVDAVITEATHYDLTASMTNIRR